MTTIAWPAPATEDAATTLLEAWRWGTTPICPHCRSERTVRTNGNPMPHRCRDCRRHFSVKTGTVMHNSKLPLTAWVIGALCVQRGMSSVQLAQELGIGHKTAWTLARRLQAASAHEGGLIADNPNPELPYLRPQTARPGDDQLWRDRLQQQLEGVTNARRKAHRKALGLELLRLLTRVAFTDAERARVKELFSLELDAMERGEERAALVAERDAITAAAEKRGPRKPSAESMAYVAAMRGEREAKRRRTPRRDPNAGLRESGLW